MKRSSRSLRPVIAVAIAAATALAADAGTTWAQTELASSASGVEDPNSGDATFAGMSRDGSRLFFTTSQRLTPDDNDAGRSDVYERVGKTTRLISKPAGTSDPNSGDAVFKDASHDGSRVFFETTERLARDDSDSDRRDVYERAGGTTTLISKPTTGINDPDSDEALFGGSSVDGADVFFSTYQRLSPDDDDAETAPRLDIYERTGGMTKLVSRPTGVPGPDTANAFFRGVSSDGRRVFFESAARLSPDDNDSQRSDVYQRAGGVTAILSTASGIQDPDSGNAAFRAAAADGSHVVFETRQSLSPDDADSARTDIYERAGGLTRLVSTSSGIAVPDNADAFFRAISANGARIFFDANERLTPDDTDRAFSDVYERSAGTTVRVSSPTGVPDLSADAAAFFGGISSDGRRVFFDSTERLTSEDNDSGRQDVYERAGGVTRLISRASGVRDPNSAHAFYSGSSTTGDHVLFRTVQRLTPNDGDAFRDDIYDRRQEATTLVSKPADLPDPDTGDAVFRGVSGNGSIAVFETGERLVPQDRDGGRVDVYRAMDATSLANGSAGDLTAPRLTSLRVVPRRLRGARSLPRPISRATRPRIEFRLSEGAMVKLTFERAWSGRRSRGRCRPRTRANRGGRRCVRYVKARGQITITGLTGRNRIRFAGRISRRRSLRSGRHRLTALAVDSAGNRARARRSQFTLLRRRR